jgi:hypothetical protein
VPVRGLPEQAARPAHARADPPRPWRNEERREAHVRDAQPHDGGRLARQLGGERLCIGRKLRHASPPQDVVAARDHHRHVEALTRPRGPYLRANIGEHRAALGEVEHLRTRELRGEQAGQRMPGTVRPGAQRRAVAHEQEPHREPRAGRATSAVTSAVTSAGASPGASARDGAAPPPAARNARRTRCSWMIVLDAATAPSARRRQRVPLPRENGEAGWTEKTWRADRKKEGCRQIPSPHPLRAASANR